jgi:mRNA-degrading endonuclease RelE of RelBE toxin-antitoxin system
VQASLERLAAEIAEPGRLGGKRVKTIHAVNDSVHRLSVGDYLAMFDVINDDRAVLVLGIVHRGDLERWLRSR